MSKVTEYSEDFPQDFQPMNSDLPYTFNSLDTSITEDAEGISIAFPCCDESLRFSTHGAPVEIDRAIEDHRMHHAAQRAK